MNKYAVAYMNFFDNNLKIEVVDAVSEKDAAIQSFGLGYAFDGTDDLEQAKCRAFEGDEVFDVVCLDKEVMYEFTYSDDYITQKMFPSDKEAIWFACNEGDHLRKYVKII